MPRMQEHALAIRDELILTGHAIRRKVLKEIRTQDEAKLVEHEESQGDLAYHVDKAIARKIIHNKLHALGRKRGLAIEIVGEDFGTHDYVVGSKKTTPDFIVHVDPIDGTREIMHSVGMAWFEAGVLPWSKRPMLGDTLHAVAVPLAYDMHGKLGYYLNHEGKAYRVDHEGKERNMKEIRPSRIEDHVHGFYNMYATFTGTGSLHSLHDKAVAEQYSQTDASRIFKREASTSAGALIDIAKGSTRVVADLRPAVPLISKILKENGGYHQIDPVVPPCMHAYDVSLWPILRDSGVVVKFYNEALQEIKPEHIPIREVEKGIGYIAAANPALWKKTAAGLNAALGKKYFK